MVYIMELLIFYQNIICDVRFQRELRTSHAFLEGKMKPIIQKTPYHCCSINIECKILTTFPNVYSKDNMNKQLLYLMSFKI